MVLHLCCTDCICFQECNALTTIADKKPNTKLENSNVVCASDTNKSNYVQEQSQRPSNVVRNPTFKQEENCVAAVNCSCFPLIMACSNLLDTYFTRLSQGTVTTSESMQYDAVRLGSYQNFPKEIPVSAIQLCNAGFFYVGTLDEIQCYSCSFKISDWAGKKDPFLLHKTFSPSCKFVLNRNDNTPVYIAPTTNNIPTDVPVGVNVPVQNELVTDNEIGMDIGPELNNYETSLTNQFDRLNTTDRTQNINFNPSSSAVEQSDAVSEDNPGQDAQTNIIERQSQYATLFPSETNTTSESMTNRDYRYESARLATFQNWPNNAPVRPEDLARCGFIYTGSIDRVQCTFCRGILKNWEEGDQPDAEHRRHFDQCPFLNNPYSVGNVAISDGQQNGSEVNVDVFPGLVTAKPMHQRFSLPSERLATFKDFPSNMVQTKEQFSRAGFFYTGISDQMKCFFCDGGLRNWEPDDEPWIEHARWFPKCGYLQLCKGDEFIKEVQNQYLAPTQKKKYQRQYPKRSNRPVDNTQVTEFMSHPIVLSVLDMGYDVNKVKQVVIYRIQDFGTDFFPNPESLLDAITEYEEELEYRQLSGENAGVENKQTAQVEKTVETARKKSLDSMTDKDALELAEEVQKLKDQRMCKVCMDEEINTVFLKCGHVVCCSNCAPAMRHCPICREIIRGTSRVFLP